MKAKYLLISLLVLLVSSELIFRFFLFSKFDVARNIQDPGFYFNYYTDTDFWKLNFLLGEPKGKAPPTPHPTLGWMSPLIKDDYTHLEWPDVKNKKPVILYGDSFGACVTKKCFQDYFNNDADFNKKCYFLNYSTGAHGIDQTYLLMKSTLNKINEPFVIYSLLTQDIDRANQAVFVGQKPYFELKDNELILKGLPIDPSPAHFFNQNTPRIFSYLYRFLSRKFQNIHGYNTDPITIENTEKITRAILKSAIVELKTHSSNFIFLIFVPNCYEESYITQNDNDDWRLQIILNILKEEKINYLITKNMVQSDMKLTKKEVGQYFLMGEGHPNDLQNAIIAAKLKEQLSFCKSN